MTSGSLEPLAGDTPAPSQDGVAASQSARAAPCPIVGLGASAGGLEAFQNFLARLLRIRVSPLSWCSTSTRRTRACLPSCWDAAPKCRCVRSPTACRSSRTAFTSSRRTQACPSPTPFCGCHNSPNRGDFGGRSTISSAVLPSIRAANAACVVLSGTGGDGSEGLRAVKEAGGLTLVQEPDTAKYDGMPKSAVATGLVDKILKVQQMPGAIRDYFDRGQANILNLPDVTDFLLRVCDELRHRLGHDFSQYKRSTMLRRIQRRMQVIGATAGEKYLEWLRDKPDEADLLFRDLLDQCHLLFPRLRGVRLSAPRSHPRAPARQGRGRHRSHLGAGLLQRRRGLQHCDPDGGGCIALEGAARRADFRHRHR